MAFPAPRLETFTAAEIAFQAEDELVSVLPRQRMEAITVAGLSVPALRPMRRVDMPMWLAIILKNQGRVSIEFPSWMDEVTLTELVEQERQQSGFSELPWHWIPISRALLSAASDDLNGDVDIVRQSLQDLEEIRRAKTRAGIALVNESHMRMDNLSLMEINEVRPALSQATGVLQQIQDSHADPEQAPDSQYDE